MNTKILLVDYTVNLRSCTGAWAYRIPRNMYNGSPKYIVKYLPRILPKLVVTVGDASRKFKITLRKSLIAINNKIGKIIFEKCLLFIFLFIFFFYNTCTKYKESFDHNMTVLIKDGIRHDRNGRYFSLNLISYRLEFAIDSFVIARIY